MRQRLLVAFMAALATCASNADIVGTDDRIELRAASRGVRALGESVALHTSRHKLVKLGGPKGPWTLLHSTKEVEHGYCAETRFADQGVGGQCTATLVAPDQVLLAGHCLEIGEPEGLLDLRERCATSAFVFHFRQLDDGSENFQVAESDVFYCKSMQRFLTVAAKGKSLKDNGERLDDYAFVTLDRAVPNGRPLRLPKDEREERELLTAPNGERVVLHHPHGVVQKVSPVGGIELTKSNVLRADIDVSRGSSGAPIVDVATGTILGILKGVTYPNGYLEKNRDEERRCHKEYVFPDAERAVIAVTATLGRALRDGKIEPKLVQ